MEGRGEERLEEKEGGGGKCEGRREERREEMERRGVERKMKEDEIWRGG